MLESIRCGICPPVPFTIVRTQSLPHSWMGKPAGQLFRLLALQLVGCEKPGPIANGTRRCGVTSGFSENGLKCFLRASPLVFVPALGELLDDLGAKSFEVARVAARDETLVGDDLLVHPVTAR